MTSGWKRSPYFKVSKPAISLKKSWGGGATVKRLDPRLLFRAHDPTRGSGCDP